MTERIEHLWALARAIRAEVPGTRLAFRLDELIEELGTYLEESEALPCA